MEHSVFSVTGMTCSHCANAVRAEVGQISGLRDVSVDLEAGTLTVASAGPVDVEAIRAAVEEAGYQLAH